MSMSYNDVWELGAVSDCCGAGVYLNGICADCNDHCTPVKQDIPMGIRPIMDILNRKKNND